MDNQIKRIYQAYLKNPVLSTDSRKIEEGALFFALRGDNFNGNKFVEIALDKGASLAIADEKIPLEDSRIVYVEDVLSALQEVANHHRNQLAIQVIGITGTNGKTTTKELIREVLSTKYKTCATIGNLNNHIGVPLTLLSLSDDDEFAVVEMGANHVGEIAALCNISEPDFGIITNIGKAHLEGFGSFEGVIKAKSEMYDFIRKKNGTVFLNQDNEILLARSQGLKAIKYGQTESGFVTGEIISSFPYVKLKCKWNTTDFHLDTQLMGSYNAENIMAAVSVGLYFHVPVQAIQKAIFNFIPKNNRSEIFDSERNKLVLDAYNANPSSMTIALKNFANTDFQNKVVILGEMLELGSYADAEHQTLVELVYSLNFDDVYFVGKSFDHLRKRSGKFFSGIESLIHELTENPLKDSAILIKGSRGNKLEQLIEVL